MSWSRRKWSVGALSLAGGWTQFARPRLAKAQAKTKAAGAKLYFELRDKKVSRGEVATALLRLNLTQEPESLSDPQLVLPPGLKGKLANRSQSQMTSIINGKMSVKFTFDYAFDVSGSKTGKYKVTAKIKVNGATVLADKSRELQILAQTKPSPVAKAGDPVMLVPHLSPEGPLYVGQMAFYQLELWTRSRDVPSSVDRPKFQAFITEDFPAPRRRIVNFRGYNYNVQSIYHRAIFPQEAGKQVISGIELEMTPSAFGSLFNRRRRARPYRVKGPDSVIEVKELPTKGKPANFPESHVGQFKMRSSVDRVDLKAGDAFTLTVEVSGQGNLRLVDPGPLPDLPGLRSYAPKRDEPEYEVQGQEVQGVVRWRYLLIASKPGTLKIPQLSLSYFDPEKARYLVARSSPLTLDIKDASGAVPKAAPQDPSAGDKETPEQNTDAPVEDSAEHMELAAVQGGDSLRDRRGASPSWLGQGRYLALVGAAPATVAAYAGWTRLAAKLGQPERIRQKKQQQELLGLLEQTQNAQEPSKAWGSLGQLLQKLALRAAGQQAQGLPRPELIAAMQKAGVAQQDAEQWGQWLDRCDASRFGAVSQDKQELEQGCRFAKAQIEALGQQGRGR